MKGSRRIGRYRVLRELARGGQGVVFLGEDLGGNEVAIKLLREQVADEESLARFRNEARITALLEHPNLVPLIEAGVAPQGPYLVTPRIQGEDLQRRVQRSGPLDERDAVSLCAGLADALEAAHQAGVLHRDVKPSNVLIDEFGEARLTDFGLASSLGRGDRLTQTGDLLGTPLYMAPEQAMGLRQRFCPATDVYGLGATLFYLLSGQPLFQGVSTLEILEQVVSDPAPALRSLRADLDPELEAICLRCLAKEPGERYPSAAELRDALGSWSERARGGRGVVGPALAALVVSLLFVVGFLYARPERSSQTAESAPPSPSPSPSASAADSAPLSPGDRALERAELAFRERRWLEARDALGAAIEARPQDPRARLLRAQVRLQLGESEAGWADFRQAAQLGARVGPAALSDFVEDERLREFLWRTHFPEGELEELALLVTDQVLHEGALDHARELRRLDALAAEARMILGELAGAARLRAFVGWFHKRVATGSPTSYYQPTTSCWHCVLDSGNGVHFTFSVLAIALGRRLGIELQGICFPGQFFCRTPSEPPLIVDAFRGQVMSLREFLGGRRVPARRLRAGTRPELMARLLGFLLGNLERTGRKRAASRARRLLEPLAREDPTLMERAFGKD